MRIGVFDSGVGGLTVLKSLYEKYPNNEYFYIGDNKHMPYGNKTHKQLLKYATTIIDYFISIDIKIVVIGCNTICSNILDKLKNKYKNLILIDVIDSTIKEFIRKNKNNVLILATEKTIDSNVYENKIKKINNNIKISNLKAISLVPIIEKDLDATNLIEEYLSNYKDIDSIILGCTHYKLIESLIPNDITTINSSDGVVKDIKKYIKDGVKDINIYTTGDVEKFNKICYRLFKINAKQITFNE